MQASDKVLRALSLYVKAGGTFGNREYLALHDKLVGIYRDVKVLEQRPEPPLEMLERWTREGTDGERDGHVPVC